MRLTAIPSDNTIILNGRVLVFNFAAAANLHAIQWYGTFGLIETTDGKQVRTESIGDVQAFIDAFIARAAVVDAPLPAKPIAQLRTEKLISLEASRGSARAG